MSFWNFPDPFWEPFRCLLDAFRMPFGAILNNLWTLIVLGTFRPWKSHPIWTPNPSFWWFFGDTLFVAFLATQFSYLLWFWGIFDQAITNNSMNSDNYFARIHWMRLAADKQLWLTMEKQYLTTEYDSWCNSLFLYNYLSICILTAF